MDFKAFFNSFFIFLSLTFFNISSFENFPELVFGVAPSNYYFSPFQEKLNFSYSFSVKVPPAIIKNLPPVCAYYKGEKLNFESNFCIIYEDSKMASFTIVITPDITRKAEDKNVYYLERKEDLPCVIYYVNQVEKVNSPDFQNYDIEWHIDKETNTKNMPKRLPDNSIIILLDPEYIDDLKVKDLDQKNIEISGSSVIVSLPDLILKSKNNSLKAIQDALDNALLASLDQKPFHRSSNDTLAQQAVENTVISKKTSRG